MPADATAQPMQLTVNGQSQQTSPGLTVAQLIDQMGLKGRAVAVERNRQVVPRRDHETTQLNQGDVVEIVTLVGGG